jgi:hypothetical protein
MRTSAVQTIRLLPDGTPLRNRLLAALPAADYARIRTHLRMQSVVTGRTLQEHGRPSLTCTSRTAASSRSRMRCVTGRSWKSATFGMTDP